MFFPQPLFSTSGWNDQRQAIFALLPEPDGAYQRSTRLLAQLSEKDVIYLFELENSLFLVDER